MERNIEVEIDVDPQTQRAERPSAPATRSNTLPQQASTSPGDGSEVHANQVPFKERVIGVAKITRGTASICLALVFVLHPPF
ncbi:hypothetical protein C0995_009820 [Termitomyces sp. Mi166|nr:hypothetical protein C0995_009820 [Termitomyces sp. Mi166\